MDESDNLDSGLTENGGVQKKTPSATGALVCGIISIPLAGLIGIILGIIAISLAGSAVRTYEAAPEKYTESSYKNAKAGRICGIIGIVASALWLAYVFGNL